jgi:phosphonate transport system substrate-binding protein
MSQNDYNRSGNVFFHHQVPFVKPVRRQRPTRPYEPLALLLVVIIFMLLFFSACGTSQPGTPTVTPTLTLTPTFPPTLTPTPEPLGTASNPFVIGVISETADSDAAAAADVIAQQVAAVAQVSAVGRAFPSYQQLLESMGRGEVHAAWLPPMTYLYASEREIANVALLTSNFGVFQYGVQFLANVESDFTPYFDPISARSSVDATVALEQFRDRRPCWVEPLSPSGYILPAGMLQIQQVPVQPGVIAQTHTAVVRALYIKGVCDFGVTFSISGDPRTASSVQNDLPDVMNRVLVIWRSDAAIPNLNLSYWKQLSEGDRQTLTRAFLEIGRSPEGRQLFTISAGNYQIDEVRAVNDDIYDPLRAAADSLNINLRDSIGK